MSKGTIGTLLLSGAVLFAVSGAVTLIPYHATMISDLGYYTLCPFAPWSTLVLLAFAGACWILRRYVDSNPR